MAEKFFHVRTQEAIHAQDQRRAMLDLFLTGQSGGRLMQQLDTFIKHSVENPETPKDENDEEECLTCTLEALVFRMASYGIAAYCLDSQKMQEETADGPT